MQFLQNDHLYGLLMDQKKILLFYFEEGSKRDPHSKLLHIWKAYLTPKIVKQDNGSSILLCPTLYSVQQFTVSSKIHVHICF